MANTTTATTAVKKAAVTKADGAAGGARLQVTLLRSTIGFNRTQFETVRGMGLRRIRHTVELRDTPETRGMIHKVRHLVSVTE
jgi:large subunit ribosomal protein L30